MNKLLAAIVLIGASTLTSAQQAARVQSPTASAAASAASASAPTKAVRRALTPEEQRDTAQFPDGSQPERPVMPQVLVPFGKKPAPFDNAASGAPAVKINDDVARCKAQAGPRQKAACVHAPTASDAAGR